MKTSYKVMIVNGSALLGFVIVAMLNPDASALVFGIACLVALVLVNGAVFLLPWLRRRRGRLAGNTTESQSESNFWLTLSVLLFLLALLLTWMMKRGYW